MTDEQDPELSDAFDELRRAVDPTVDVDAGLDALHDTSTHRRTRVPRAALVSAAAVLVLVASIGGAAWWRNSGQTVSADGGADGAPSGECAQEFIVYVDPHAEVDTIDTVEHLIAEQRGTIASTYMGREDTYGAFMRLFAESSPDFLASIDSSDLPTSFVVRTSPEWTAGQIAWIEGTAGVYRVEPATTNGCSSPATIPESRWGPGSGFEPSPTPAGPGAGSGRGPNLQGGTMTSVTTGRPEICGATGQRTRAETAAGCPLPGVHILGSVIVDGKRLVVTDSTTLLTCSGTDDSMPISFAEVQQLASDPFTSRPVATWFLDPSGEGWLPVVVVSQLYFGSCG